MHKKFIIPCLLTAIAFISCSKDDGSDSQPTPTTPGNTNQISTPPVIFTQKLLLEYYTATWSASCPDADTKRDQLMLSYPNKVIPVAIHQSDGMSLPYAFTMDATFGSNPASGMLNRKASLGNVLLNRTQWLSNATGCLTGTPVCGLAINSTVSGATASVEVQASFRNYLSGNYNITVLLVEKDVTGTGNGFDQSNGFNGDPSSPYYNLGNPIIGYKHQYVARKIITAALGDPIDASVLVTDGLLKKNYTVDITGINKDKAYIIAYVNKLGTSAITHQIMNVQMGALGALKNWD